MARSELALPEQAAARAPSIVFLDELDGLVPARSKHSGHGGDQVVLACARMHFTPPRVPTSEMV